VGDRSQHRYSAYRPWQNGSNESFNGKFRGECLSMQWFKKRIDAKILIEEFRRQFNEVRPHSSLGQLTPAEFKQQLLTIDSNWPSPKMSRPEESRQVKYMSETNTDKQGSILAFAALLEVATGLAMMFDPGLVAQLLLGGELAGTGTTLARWAGVVLVALGVACWPHPPRAGGRSSAVRGMLIYNALTAMYLGYLGGFENLHGLLLWPAVVLHAVVAVAIVGTRRPGAAYW
jgi:Integrase core domain